jgi:hypothetical protein
MNWLSFFIGFGAFPGFVVVMGLVSYIICFIVEQFKTPWQTKAEDLEKLCLQKEEEIRKLYEQFPK